jgi:DNA transposition AAA+ family ATPase
VDPTYFETYKEYRAEERVVVDPTTLILVDEADRLQMNSLEQIRSIFDEGTAGMVLIGMPGIEKRVARFPQFYSRIGFVHEFRPLDASQVQELLEKRWTPACVVLPNEQLVPEVIASLIRMSGGNFRLSTRLLTQSNTTNNSETLRQIILKATAPRKRRSPSGGPPPGIDSSDQCYPSIKIALSDTKLQR